MKYFFLLFNLFFLSNAVPYEEYAINTNSHAEYLTQYEGKTQNNIDAGRPFLEYSTAFDMRHIINTYTDVETCKSECAIDQSCLGVYLHDANTSCHSLNNLGTYKETEYDSYSQHKMIFYNNPISTDSIRGVSMSESEYLENMTIYLDLNDNGEFEQGEPYTKTDNLGRFQFDNLEEGVYIVRQVFYNDCSLIYPGARGINDASNVQTGFADRVLYYHHNKYYLPMGGRIIRDGRLYSLKNVSFDYILANDHDTYMSFNSNDSIVLGFLNDIIIDLPGDDIFFEMVGEANSSIHGHVYVSQLGIDYHYIGILNTTSHSFDLNDIGYNTSVSRVRVDFFGDDNIGPLNVSGVRGKINITYSPEYGTAVLVPGRWRVYFINDCSYFYMCSTYCSWMKVLVNDYRSCNDGCNLFMNTQNCDCTNESPHSENPESCFDGCYYAMRRYVYPDYSVYPNAEGSRESNFYGSTCKHCLDNHIDLCESSSDCDGFTQRYDGQFSMHNDHMFYYTSNSTFLVRNSFNGSDNLNYHYYTPTTTQTTTVSSTQSSSQTTTLSTTQTSTLSTTQTSTLSTTQTSTLSTTPSTTLTTSLTSTVTSTQSTTPSTTVTTETIYMNQVSTSTDPGIVAGIVLACIVVIFIVFMAHRYYRERNVGVVYNSYDNAMFNKESDNVYDSAGHYFTDEQENHATITNSGYMDVPEITSFDEEDDNYIDVTSNEV